MNDNELKELYIKLFDEIGDENYFINMVKYFEQLLSDLYLLILFRNTECGIKFKICLKTGISDFFPKFVLMKSS